MLKPDLTESFLALVEAAFDLDRCQWDWTAFHEWGAAHPAAFKLVTTEDEYRLATGEEPMVSEWMRHLTEVGLDFRNGELTGDETMTVQSIGAGSGVSLNKIPCLLAFG